MSLISAIQNGAAYVLMWGQQHASALYTAVGVTSGLGAVITGIAVTPENTRKIDNEKAERERLGLPEMRTVDVIRMVGLSYLPTIFLFGTSAACFILNTVKAERKIATLAGLYSMSEKNFGEYREKVKEMFGERKERKVRDEVAIDKAKEAARSPALYMLTGDGNYPCLDAWSNTKFRSSQLAVEKARISVLDRLRNEMYISLQEVYDEMRLPVRKNEDGTPLIDRSDIGWTVDDQLEFCYSYTPDEMTGEPMMVITFMPPPHADFNRLF